MPFQIHPRRLFLIDGIGALLSAFLLGVILPRFNAYIGVPIEWLLTLSSLAILFAFYSFSHYMFFPENWKLRMRIIAIINLLYCLFTAIVTIGFAPELKIIGIVYFALEILIVCSLAFLELKQSASQNNQL